MKTIITILISIIFLAGCTVVQPQKITPEEEKSLNLRSSILKIILDASWQRQYLEYQLRKAEKEFGVEQELEK